MVGKNKAVVVAAAVAAAAAAAEAVGSLAQEGKMTQNSWRFEFCCFTKQIHTNAYLKTMCTCLTRIIYLYLFDIQWKNTRVLLYKKKK